MAFSDSSWVELQVGFVCWHPKVGASWEGYVIEQVLQITRPSEAYFWGIHNVAELDLLFFHRRKRYGIKVKFSEAPEITHFMQTALRDLD